MGYELHITRKANWVDEDGPMISLHEWQRVIEEDEDLSPYEDVGEEDRGKVASYAEYEGALLWDRGEVRSKNPDQALIIKMVALAATLGARVQGDDGEVYRAGGTSFQLGSPATESKPGFVTHVRGWLRARRVGRELQQAAPAFVVGSRVRDSLGYLGTVLEVDRRANGGLGRVVVRFDDGREQCVAYVASGLGLADGPTDVSQPSRMAVRGAEPSIGIQEAQGREGGALDRSGGIEH
jgi:hypothetical protein